MLIYQYLNYLYTLTTGKNNFMNKTTHLTTELEEVSLAIQRKRSQIKANNIKLSGTLSPLEQSNVENSSKVMDSQIDDLKLDAITIQLKLSTQISEL